MEYVLDAPAPTLPPRLRMYYIVVNANMIQHNIEPKIKGALIKSVKTGQYRIYSADDDRNYAVSKIFAKELDNYDSPAIAFDNSEQIHF